MNKNTQCTWNCQVEAYDVSKWASAGIKGCLWNTSSSFFQRGRQQKCPKHSQETQCLVPYSQGTMVTYVTWDIPFRRELLQYFYQLGATSCRWLTASVLDRFRPSLLPLTSPLWPTPPRRRTTVSDANHLALSPVLRPGWARSPSAFRLRPRSARCIYNLYAAERAFASLNSSTTVSTDVPNNSEGETGASRRNRFSFSPMSTRFIHRCLLVATIAAIDLPIAAAVCLVAQRARSVVRRNCYRLRGSLWPWSKSFSKSAWYACNTDIVCRAAPAWPAAACALPFKRNVSFSGLDGRAGAFSDNVTSLQ